MHTKQQGWNEMETRTNCDRLLAHFTCDQNNCDLASLFRCCAALSVRSPLFTFAVLCLFVCSIRCGTNRSTRTAATVKCRSSPTRTRRCAIGCATSSIRRCPTPRSSRSSTTRSGCTVRRPRPLLYRMYAIMCILLLCLCFLFVCWDFV